jgi:hypothetical protein
MFIGIICGSVIYGIHIIIEKEKNNKDEDK